MRELHVVALSEDGRHVVLATRAGTASGEFRVALDERLSAAVRGELPAPGRDVPPSISPRDIQARLRDGEAPEQIAASAGVPLSRVERYAGPVLAELDRMITGARAAVVSRPRLGASSLPLGEAVEAHLAEVVHLAEGSVRWSARRTDQGRWVVEVSWSARGRRRTAGWQYDPARRELVAVDGPSAVLGHVEADAGSARATARPARPAPPPAVRGGGRTAGAAPPSVPSAGGRAVRASAPQAAGSSRTAAAAVTGPAPQAARPPAAAARAVAAGRTTAPTTAPAAAPAPPPAARRRAAAAPAPAPAPARRRAAAPAAAATPDRAQPRRPAPRRSAVPSLEQLAAAPADAAAPGAAAPGTAAPDAARAGAATPEPVTARTSGPGTPAPPADPAAPPTSPAAPVPDATSTPSLRRPPVLRVVPPADPEHVHDADEAEPPAEAPPARRAAGQRAGGRDWADVLMGGAPAERRQD